MCLVEQGGIFGDIEIIAGMKTYMNHVMTISPTTIFAISAANVERLIIRKNPRTVESLKTGVITKLYNRTHSVQGYHIPIMKHLLFKLTEEIKPKPQLVPPLKLTKSLPDADVLFQHLIESFKENRSELIEPLLPGTVYYKRLMQEKLRLRANKKKHEKKENNQNQSSPWNKGGATAKVGRSSSISSIQQMYDRINDENLARKAMLESIMDRREKRLELKEKQAAEKATKTIQEQLKKVEDRGHENDCGVPEHEEDYVAPGVTAKDHAEYLKLVQKAEKPLPLGLLRTLREESTMSTDLENHPKVFMTESPKKVTSAPPDRIHEEAQKSNSSENLTELAPYKQKVTQHSGVRSATQDHSLERKIRSNAWVEHDVNNNNIYTPRSNPETLFSSGDTTPRSKTRPKGRKVKRPHSEDIHSSTLPKIDQHHNDGNSKPGSQENDQRAKLHSDVSHGEPRNRVPTQRKVSPKPAVSPNGRASPVELRPKEGAILFLHTENDQAKGKRPLPAEGKMLSSSLTVKSASSERSRATSNGTKSPSDLKLLPTIEKKVCTG